MTTECKSYSSHSSSSSSMDSSGHLPAAPSGRRSARCDVLSTDLQLGLSLSSSSFPADSTPSTSSGQRQETLFVKVYMEGVPIGRKIDLLLLEGYDGLLAQLSRMFKTNITYADVMDHRLVPRANDHDHVLTYEDQEGDWMMVGDVPWELFLTSVKKLRIARADKC